MTTSDLKARTRRLYDEVFTAGKVELIDEFMADDFVEHEAFPGVLQGREAARAFVTSFREAFPDLVVQIEDMIAEGEKVVSRVRFIGTHQAEFMGIAATGNKIDMAVIDILAWRDDKVTDHWAVSDELALFNQLGVMEIPA